MTSEANDAAIAELQALSENAKGQLAHVLGNGLMIVSGLAQLMLTHDDSVVRARARVIIHTIDLLNEQKRRMLTATE